MAMKVRIGEFEAKGYKAEEAKTMCESDSQSPNSSKRRRVDKEEGYKSSKNKISSILRRELRFGRTTPTTGM